MIYLVVVALTWLTLYVIFHLCTSLYMLYLTCVPHFICCIWLVYMPPDFMDTLDHMSPSLDDVFHMATHLIEPFSFGGRWGTTTTFNGGHPTTWERSFHSFGRTLSLSMTWLFCWDTLAPMGYELTLWWWCDAHLHDDLTPLDGTLHLYMMIWYLLVGHCHSF